MDKLAELSHGAKVVLGAAIAYFIVLFFRWQEVDVGGVVSVGQSGWHGVGVICGLLALAIIAWQAVRLANINLEVGVTPSMVTAALAVLLIVFTIIKFLVDNEFRTFWAWLGLILAIVIVVGAWMNMDRDLLEAVALKFGGGPVGLSTLAVSLGEEPDTLEDVYEPYLLQLGFLQRTPRGRVITDLGRNHLGATRGDDSLF